VRLLGQLKFGFFPAAPAAVRALATHLSLAGDPARTAILDPCAGEGEALALVAAALGVDGPRVHAIELDDGRADAVRARLPGARVLGPCSFLAAAVGRGFGLAYCNPPFDDELGGGGREELAFLSASTGVLVPGGVLALVVPRRTGSCTRRSTAGTTGSACSGSRPAAGRSTSTASWGIAGRCRCRPGRRRGSRGTGSAGRRPRRRTWARAGTPGACRSRGRARGCGPSGT
jgi:hypothetical protein